MHVAGSNKLSGSIPDVFAANTSHLQRLDLSSNSMTGQSWWHMPRDSNRCSEDNQNLPGTSAALAVALQTTLACLPCRIPSGNTLRSAAGSPGCLGQPADGHAVAGLELPAPGGGQSGLQSVPGAAGPRAFRPAPLPTFMLSMAAAVHFILLHLTKRLMTSSKHMTVASIMHEYHA